LVFIVLRKRSKALPGPIRAGDPTDPPPGFDWLIHFSLDFVAWGIGVNIGVNVIHSLVYSSVLRVRLNHLFNQGAIWVEVQMLR